MKSNFKYIVGLFIAGSSLFIACNDDETTVTPMLETEEIVLAANRSSASISFINAMDNSVIKTLSIPNSEPMYVNYVAAQDKIYVGDRAQSLVHVIDASTREVTNQISVGNGVFHMWPTNSGNQLWVNSDMDNTTTVIDLKTETVIETIDLGGKPHDVFFNPDDSKAYISILVGDISVPDEIHAYNTSTFMRINTVMVGDDPHVFYLNSQNKLYSPNQTGGLVVLDDDLNEITNIAIDGSHGIFSANGTDVYVADLPGSELYKVNGVTNEVMGMPLATTVTIPHNLVVNAANNKLFVTHSSPANDKVTVYDLSTGSMTLSETVTVESNPFGIAYFTRTK